jgi:hypothetical protein
MIAKMTVRKHQVFMSGEGGRIVFRCDHCEHYPRDETCDHPEIIKLARKGEYGLTMCDDGVNARVMPDDCSDYYEPKKR